MDAREVGDTVSSATTKPVARTEVTNLDRERSRDLVASVIAVLPSLRFQNVHDCSCEFCAH